MRVGAAGTKLIAEFEGFSPVLYDDPSGNATIGYGFLVHLGRYHRQPGICALCDQWRGGVTEARARELLRDKAQSYGDAVERMTGVTLNQNQYDALTSLCFNIGAGGYLNSGVRAVLNRGRYDLVCGELAKIIHGSDGVALPGLIRRRQAECDLFNSPVVVEEEPDMKPFLAWCPQQSAMYFIGPSGARWITDAGVVAELEAIFGKCSVSLSNTAINAIGLAK